MMGSTLAGRKRLRKFFGKLGEAVEMPNLIEVQKASYDQFLMVDEPNGGRPDEGLQSVFRSVFPISDFANTALLEFVKYTFEPPKYDVDECRQRGMTFSAPLKVTLRLIVFDVDPDTGAKSVKDIKEQDVYMGEMPLMTENGTFIVNGTERVIVSQMHRSPGVFFDHDKGKTHSSASCSSRRASSRTRAPGSTSSSTPRTSCMPASTGSARSRSRRCCSRSGSIPRRSSTRSTRASSTRSTRAAGASRSTPTRCAASRPALT
jgi:DNA-directed RNA polymerase beta subunit